MILSFRSKGFQLEVRRGINSVHFVVKAHHLIHKRCSIFSEKCTERKLKRSETQICLTSFKKPVINQKINKMK